MPRVHGPVDEKSLVVLKGNVSAAARAEFDRGPAPASTQLTHVRLVLARTSAQQAALDKYDAELQDKSSPNYQKWLTPEQYGKLYGPADADIAAIVAWLESHGLQVESIWPGRTDISFSGSVQQIEEALHTSIHSFESNGEQFYANVSDPSIPAALASVVSGVAHLNTKKPRPLHVSGRPAALDPATGKRTPVSSSSSYGPRAELTGGSGTCATAATCDPYILYLVPGDAATIYDTPNTVLNANFSSGTSYTGTGVTIGIGGDATINAGTVALYRQSFLGNVTQPTISYCDVYTSPPATPACSGSSTGLGIGTSDQDEAYIDTELSAGLAPGAAIHYYASSDLDGAIEAAINENTVDIFSLSFGACELDLTTSDNVLVNGWWQQAATQGIAVTVSSGDDGSASCDNNNTQTTANAGLKVSGFASTPYNIAVGGTDLVGLVPTGTSYSTTNFLQYALPSSGNSSSLFYRTALKYIPESTWNDSTNVNTTISANVPVNGTSNIVAGSGGKSSCVVNTTTYPNSGEVRGTCQSGYSKPTWQRGPGTQNDSVRDLPDISLMSGDGSDYAAWTVCTDDPISQGSPLISNCSKQSDGNTYIAAFGGTSTAAPAFAGILALVQQKTGKRLGQAAKELYDLYNGANAGAVFHDITVGNNSVPCDTGTPDCQLNTAGFLYLTGYDTGTGYDLATGIGSVDANQLIKYWGTTTGVATSTVTVAPASNTIARGSALSVLATVQGSATTGNPTGQVTLSGGGYTSAAQPLTASGTDSATSTFTIPVNSLTRGSDSLTVSYAGDSGYAPNTGSGTVTVTGLTPTVAVMPASINLNSGAAFTVTALVTGTGATPTGTVTLSGGGYTSPAGTLDGTGKFVFTVPANSFTTGGNVPLTVNYSGDGTYNAASNTATVTITISSFSLSATNLTVTAGDTTGNVSTVSVNPTGGYTGSVTLTAAVTSSPAGAVGAPTLTVTGSPVNITSANPVAATVTVATTAASAVRAARNDGAGWFKAAGGSALAALLLFCLPLGSRRTRRMLSLMLIVVAATFTAAGCGGGGSPKILITPSVTVSPSKSTLSTSDAITVAVSVSGGTSAATGTVSLSGGGFSSGATSLSMGAATINIPANSFTSTGSVTLTASYSGDSNFNPATGTATLTVNKPKTTAGTYTVTVTGKDTTANITQTTTFTLTVN